MEKKEKKKNKNKKKRKAPEELEKEKLKAKRVSFWPGAVVLVQIQMGKSFNQNGCKTDKRVCALLDVPGNEMTVQTSLSVFVFFLLSLFFSLLFFFFFGFRVNHGIK